MVVTVSMKHLQIKSLLEEKNGLLLKTQKRVMIKQGPQKTLGERNVNNIVKKNGTRFAGMAMFTGRAIQKRCLQEKYNSVEVSKPLRHDWQGILRNVLWAALDIAYNKYVAETDSWLLVRTNVFKAPRFWKYGASAVSVGRLWK